MIYDNVDGISAAIKDGTLPSLRRLMDERQCDYENLRRPLKEFIIDGTVLLDAFGRTALCSVMIDKINVSSMMSSVVDVEELRKHFCPVSAEPPECSQVQIIRSSIRVPGDGDRCSVCDRGWTTIKDLNDCVHHDELWWHPRCREFAQSMKAYERWCKLAAQAGFTSFIVELASNEYCRELCCMPWARIRTHLGVVKVGQRKNVVNIDWSDTGLDAAELFKEENVTKGTTFIHSWSPEDDVRYLAKVRRALVNR